MFRAQQNAFDDAVAKATDENLTNEDWSLILDVCDRVGAESSGAKDAVAAIIKRLAHRNANVQLYTLELANALSQNCGRKIHQELASRSFTDALLRLANDRNTHQQVKSKILERMAEWTEMFSKDADLGIMEQAYSKLKSQNPNLHPPSKPTKKQITDVDRQKEEEELQMALALSVKEKKLPPQASGKKTSPGPSAAASSQQQRPVQPASQGTTAATVSRVKALYDFVPSEPGELQFQKGDIIAVLESVFKDWWKGSLRGQQGIFPLNYVEKLADPTADELQREAQMEAEVFGEIKNVEKLLTLLSTSSSDLNARENEEITELYHSTLAIRPKLIELIRKYSQKKDDFTQLNEKFIKARRDYEALLESSMSQPSQRQHQQYPYGGGYPQGAAPPQQGPGRFYTPGPDHANSRPPQHQNPPRNDPQPFTYANQPGHPQQPPAQYPLEPQQSGGSGILPHDPYGGHRPQSTYDNPQELSTSVYASPAETRPSHTYPPHIQAVQQQQQQQTQEGYSPSVYSADEAHSSQQIPSQPPASSYGGQAPYPSNTPASQPPAQQHPYPTYDAPPPPSQGPPSQAPPQAPSPSLGANPYPTLNSGPPGASGYQSYRPPAPAALQPGHTTTAGSDVSDYYR